MRRFWPAAAVLALSLATSAVERDGDWPRFSAGGYHVLEGDIHAHSIFAGALPTPVDLVLLARRQQLDFVAVGEHNSLFGALVTAAFARWLYPEVIVLASEEVTTRRYHAHAIGISRAIDPFLPLEAVADETHRQGGILVAAHPVERFWDVFLDLARKGKLDAVETVHPIRFVRRGRIGWRGEDLIEFWRRASKIAGRPLASVGGSDYHGLSALGYCRTVVLARERTVAGIVEAIRVGRAVAAGPDGKLEGNPRWVKLLEDAGYRVRPSRHSYAEASTAGQALAWAVFACLLASLLWRRTTSAPR